MKNVRLFFLLWCVVLGTTALFAQSEGDFRSYQSGSWSNVNSWERFDGASWVTPAPGVPTSATGAIAILTGHAITLDVDTTVDQLTVNAGAMLSVAATKRLSIADGADSVDMIVHGTLDEYGTITATGRISIEDGGLFIYSVPAGGDIAMPTYTWRTGSTCRVDSTTGTTPTNLKNQTLYNLIWNGTASGANGGPNFNDATVIYGDVTVLSSKSFQWRVTNLSGGQIKNIYIRGDLNISGATATVTSTGSGADTLAKAIINIDGDVNMTAGTWSLLNSGSAYAEWKIKGNINITGGALSSGASGWAYRRTLNFCGGTTQTFTLSSPATMNTAPTNYKVSAGSTVQLNFALTLSSGSVLTLESGKILTTNSTMLTLPATGTIVGGSASSYIDGPLTLTVASTTATKTFPIGKGASYRPVTLTVNQDATTATTYTAEMFNSAPAVRTLPPALLEVSSVRYYTVTKGTGANLSPTLGATVQLNYEADDLINKATMVRVAKDDGAGNWLNLGGSGTADTTGYIVSNAFTSFSDFVLAIADTNVASVPPTVNTTAMSYISTTFATSGGNVTNDGGGPVLERGVCWNTSGEPIVSDAHTSNGTGAGAYTSSVTGLTPGTTYYLRSYATNSAGTGYGNEITFFTLASVIPPTVTTTAISNIQVKTAVSGGNVTDWGGDSVTVRGICWNTTGSPTVSNSHSSDGSGLGAFTSGMSQLTGGVTYYVRAYATNSAGTGYGDERTFATQTPQPDTTVVVAQDGSGDYVTVQAAFRAVPTNYTGKWTIFVKKGIYYEKDTLASGKINVTLQGEDRDSTIITYDDYADRYGSGVPGTSGSFTIAIDASDFTAKDITFRNTYSPQIGVTGTQAVALRTQGDRHEYINCKILGYQDTYYTWGGNGTGRMYHRNCFIEGTVDFIFGRNIVVFDSCTIHEIRNNATITAGSTDASSKYGYVFRNCTIVTDSLGYDGVPITTTYLGRPWQGSPRTVFINSYEPATVNPAGWQSWNVTPALYGEFNCFGAGYATGSRVAWSSQLSDAAAAQYSLSEIFAKSSAASSLILYDWMPASAISDLPLMYRVTAEAGANGTISPAGISNATNNGSKIFKLSPAPGYYVDSLLLNGVPVVQDTAYTVTGITANKTLRAVFALAGSVTITASAGEHGAIAPQGNVSVTQGEDKLFTITPNPGYHIDSLIVDGISIATAGSYNFHYVVTGHEIRATFAQTGASVMVGVQSGWNMVSLPLTFADSRKSTLFPAAISQAFAYIGSYVPKDTLQSSLAYWLKFAASDSLPLAGYQRLRDTIQVNAGWNMIGSISIPVAVSSIVSVPGGIMTSQFFGYHAGYSSAEIIEPGKGYWVKVSEAGSLILAESDATALANRIAIVPTNELPPPPPQISERNEPNVFALWQNYPNPFNPSTEIKYSIPATGYVTLKVFNVLGQEVATLADGVQSAGIQTLTWNASALPSGVYYYRLQSGEMNETKIMMLVK